MEKFRLRIQEEEERMTPIDAKPNNFHFRPKHQDHVAHKKGVSQLRSILIFYLFYTQNIRFLKVHYDNFPLKSKFSFLSFAISAFLFYLLHNVLA